MSPTPRAQPARAISTGVSTIAMSLHASIVSDHRPHRYDFPATPGFNRHGEELEAGTRV